MSALTKNEMALVYLSGFAGTDPVLTSTVPMGMTQDGIAGALGITRGYAALIAGRMVNLGLLECIQKHISGAGGSKRLAYFLTPKGLEEAAAVRERLRSEGGGIVDAFLTRGIDGFTDDELLELEQDELDAVGWLCVMSRDVHRDELPEGISALVRFGKFNEVRLRPETKKRLLASATEDDLARWHCIAADWFAELHPMDPERYVHLACGRRTVEAAGLIRMDRCRILDSPDRDHLEALKAVSGMCGDPEVQGTAVMLALSLNDMDSAREVMSMAAELRGEGRAAMRAEMAIMEGDCDAGLKDAVDSYDGGPDSALRLARGYMASRMPKTALPFIRHARRAMMRSGCLYGLDEAYRLESLALMRLGDCRGALKRLDLAYEACTDSCRAECIWRMRVGLLKFVSKHRVCLEGVQVGYVEVPDVLYVPFEHGEPLESESPRKHRHVDAEGRHDLGPEYARAAELHPLAVEEDLELQRGLGVREVRGPDADLVEAHPGVELADDGNQHVEVGVLVDDDALDLGELRQVGGVDGLLPEDPGDGERLPGGIGVLGDVLDGADGAVGPQEGRLGPLPGPLAAPSRGAGVPSVLVDRPDL